MHGHKNREPVVNSPAEKHVREYIDIATHIYIH